MQKFIKNMMSGMTKFFTSYIHLMDNIPNICINFLSQKNTILFSLNVNKNNNVYQFKTMNAFHVKQNRFNKLSQLKTYTDSFGVTYYNIIIS